MEWISLSEIKKHDLLINLGLVLEIVEYQDVWRVKVSTKFDLNDIWLTFGKDSMVLIATRKKLLKINLLKLSEKNTTQYVVESIWELCKLFACFRTLKKIYEMNRKLIRASELRERLGGIGKATLWRWMKRGLPVIRVGKTLLFDSEAVDEWLKKESIKSAAYGI